VTSGRTVVIAFGIALVIFFLTHFAPIPGTLNDLMSVNGGHAILDQQPVFSTQAVYDRLDAFGTDGRALYQRFLLTTDIVFPLGLLAFLFLFARFSAERLVGWYVLRTFLPLVPAIWFAFDMMENLSIVALLADYPAQNEFIASYLGLITLAKRYALAASILAPATLLIYTTAKRYFLR
jgi:hypothetical protein